MSSLYHDELVEHYKSSPYRKKLNTPSVSFGDSNPSCGDKLEIAIQVAEGKIVDIGFQGSGCVISQAAMSMICEEFLHQPLEKITSFSNEDLLALLHIEIGPVRMKCATLGLHVINQALSKL